MIANLTLVLASAMLLILAQPAWDIRLLAPVALTPLVIAAAREPVAIRRFLLGELAGIVYWFGACHWIRFVLIEHGDMTPGLSWVAMGIFSVAKALHLGVFALLARPLLSLGWPAAAAVAALWTGLERTHGPLGFAWLTLGNAGIDMSVPMRLAPVVGTYGLSFVFALMGVALAMVIQRRPRRDLAPLLALPLLYLLPALPEASKGTESAVSLQPNVAQKGEWIDTEVRELHNRMIYLTMESALDREHNKPVLMLWPEVPAPVYYYTDAPFRGMVTKLAQVTGTHFLFGAVSFTEQGAPLNSAVFVSPSGELVSRYDKMYLVPFGEFIPPMFSWVNRITKEAGDFEPGRSIVVSKAAGHTVGTFICYESAFPHLVRQFADAGAEALVNLTNDGYFGRTSARVQHLLLARMRAAENRRWVLRSTNDGWTVSIDPAGRIVDRFPPFEQRAGRLSFSWIAEKTLYTRYGDWFAWLCLALSMGAALFTLWRESRLAKIAPPG